MPKDGHKDGERSIKEKRIKAVVPDAKKSKAEEDDAGKDLERGRKFVELLRRGFAVQQWVIVSYHCPAKPFG